LSARLNPNDAGPPNVRIEPAPRVSAAPVTNSIEPMPTSPQNDQNLAEMAQQLEAALRRTPDNRPPVTDPQALPPAAPPRAPARDSKARIEPRLEPKVDPKLDRFDFKPEPRLDSPAPATPGKNLYENLEQEMASLLGRPSGKT
jgi:hypothetical protein